ncbi:MAG: SCO family protein [Betaproteobacteria bacterium]|nr:SCO family protein [Betaproteobacteria bacterium]
MAMAPLAPASLLLGALLACAAAAAQEMNAPDAERAVGISQAVIGKPAGDHAFTDRLHRNVRLADYRGKPLVVSFIYTSCFQVCPATTQFLSRAVAAARQALGNDSFQVVSIGFNQPFDNPDALAAFARKAGVDDPRWEFLAPPAPDVPALARDFGFTYYATPKGFDHLTQLTVVDAEGVIYRQIYGESFDLPMLVGPLKELLSGQASGEVSVAAVWTKVKLFCTVYDPAAGRYRLNYSLFVEIFAGASILIGIAWFLIGQSRRPPEHV